MGNIKEYNSRYPGPRWKEKPAKQLSPIYLVQPPPFFISPTQIGPNPNKYGYDNYVPQYGETGHTAANLAIALGAGATTAVGLLGLGYVIRPIISQVSAREANKLKFPHTTPVIMPMEINFVPVRPSPQPTPTAIATLESVEPLSPIPTPNITAVATAKPTLTEAEIIAHQLKSISLISISRVKPESPIPTANPIGTEWKVTANGEIQLVMISGNPAVVARYNQKTRAIVVDRAFAPTFRQMIEEPINGHDTNTVVEFVRGNEAYAKIFTLPYDGIDIKPAAVIVVDNQNISHLVPIPSLSNLTWDAENNRFVVKNITGSLTYSYIDANGIKDYSPSINSIQLLMPDKEKEKVLAALQADRPIIMRELSEMADNFYTKPRAKEFANLIETNYPGIKFNDVLAAIKQTVIEMQEGVLRIKSIGTPEDFKREYPSLAGNIDDRFTQFMFRRQLNSSHIVMPLKYINDPSELHGGLIKEYFSFAVAQTIVDNPELLEIVRGREPQTNLRGPALFIDRFGVFVVGVGDLSSLTPIQVDQKRRLDHAFKPDSEIPTW